MTGKVKYGVIGLGWFGEKHCEVLSGIGAVDLYALSTRTESRLKALGEEFGVKRLYTDYNEMLADLQQAVQQLADLKGTLSESPAALLHALQLRDNTSLALERIYAYAALLKDQDTRQSAPQALFHRERRRYWR